MKTASLFFPSSRALPVRALSMIVFRGPLRESLLEKRGESFDRQERFAELVAKSMRQRLDVAFQLFLAFGYGIGPNKPCVNPIGRFQQPSSKRIHYGRCLHN